MLRMHTPGFTIQVTELAVLWNDLRGVDFGVVGEHVLPPFLFVHFLQVNINEFLVLYLS